MRHQIAEEMRGLASGLDTTGVAAFQRAINGFLGAAGHFSVGVPRFAGALNFVVIQQNPKP